MSVTKLPSGMWRAQVYSDGKNVSVSKILGGPGTFPSKREAVAARAKARERVGSKHASVTTVREFREKWLTDPLYARPKQSTMIHYEERTKAFAEKYGTLRMLAVDDALVAEWIAGGKHRSTIPPLCAMFNDALSAKAGRIVSCNPFARLGLHKSKGNAKKLPPDEPSMWNLVGHADELTPPSFAAYLETACFTAARPGELDALRWENLDFAAGDIEIREQWNAKVGAFTEPKYGPYTLALVPPIRKRLLTMKRDSDAPFVFTTLRGHHYTPSTRNHHWNRVRAAAGLGNTSLYLCTRHYFGWYATNVLELPPHIVAEQLGHKDGGKLVSQLYGHLEGKVARRRIRDAYANQAQVRPLKLVNEESA